MGNSQDVEAKAADLLGTLRNWRPTDKDGALAQEQIDHLDKVENKKLSLACLN